MIDISIIIEEFGWKKVGKTLFKIANSKLFEHKRFCNKTGRTPSLCQSSKKVWKGNVPIIEEFVSFLQCRESTQTIYKANMITPLKLVSARGEGVWTISAVFGLIISLIRDGQGTDCVLFDSSAAFNSVHQEIF